MYAATEKPQFVIGGIAVATRATCVKRRSRPFELRDRVLPMPCLRKSAAGERMEQCGSTRIPMSSAEAADAKRQLDSLRRVTGSERHFRGSAIRHSRRHSQGAHRRRRVLRAGRATLGILRPTERQPTAREQLEPLRAKAASRHERYSRPARAVEHELDCFAEARMAGLEACR